mmetsp:Transcript_52455/g.94238  ORF Transcript_52455/g.94238 Transcript_52455/m.94238 type:complete len:369 (-) Transcript_52455:85-1191(-)
MSSSFRKIVVIPEKYGSTDFQSTTKIVQVPALAPRAGEITLKVTHTGIEASDIVQMKGGYGALFNRKPAASWNGSVQIGDLGCEGVGVVTAVGPEVSGFAAGDTVSFGGFGVSFRESVNLNVNRPGAFLQKVPAPSPEWTALPVSALTATGGLAIAGNIKKGQNVLVTGAAGGTGHIAVQWAKAMCGCRVAGTCGSPEKAAMLKDLGCDVVVNYKTDDAEAELRRQFPDGFDLIYEAVGGRIGNIARRLLSPTGFLVQIGYVGTDYTGETKGDRDGRQVKLKDGQGEMFWFCGDWKSPNKTKADWDQLVADTTAAIAAGKIRIMMDDHSKDFVGIESVYAAQARMRKGENAGKIYATIDPAHAPRSRL